MDLKKKTKYIENKITKETYTQEEVRALLINEASFTHQQTVKDIKDNTVSKEDFDALTEKYNALDSKSKPLIQKGKEAAVKQKIKALVETSKYKDEATLRKTLAIKFGEDNIVEALSNEELDEKELISYLEEKAKEDDTLTKINEEKSGEEGKEDKIPEDDEYEYDENGIITGPKLN